MGAVRNQGPPAKVPNLGALNPSFAGGLGYPSTTMEKGTRVPTPENKYQDYLSFITSQFQVFKDFWLIFYLDHIPLYSMHLKNIPVYGQ